MHSFELEQQVIAGLLQHPAAYNLIHGHINNSDFVSDINKTIFSFISSIYEKGDSLNAPLLAEKISLSGISFEDNINISDYLQALSLRKSTKEAVVDAAKDVKKLSIRREIQSAGLRLSSSMEKMSPNCSYSEIINKADEIYNNTLSSYENQVGSPKNIFEEMSELVEHRGENIITDFGPKGPHPRLHQIYGSLLRPGNITTIVARSGVGKTNFVVDFCTKVSISHNIPVLHLDNGEMSKEEIIMRQCAAFSGVPIRLLETGNWRRAGDDIVKKVRDVWDVVKNIQFYYDNIGGMAVDEMIQKIKHFYYSFVGRGNPMILSYDYIKTTSENMGNKPEYQVVGEMVDKLKRLVQTELVFDDEPAVALMTSVQSNRSGITNNRRSDSLVEDESTVSLSDRITSFTSHLFSLRQKTLDEIADEEGFGTHKLTCFKYRHLGEDVHRAIQPVRTANGDLKRNFINLSFDNFAFTEVGDLQDMVDSQLSADLEASGQHDPLTDI